MRKKKEPDPYLWLMDPDPGGPKTCTEFNFEELQNLRQELHFLWKKKEIIRTTVRVSVADPNPDTEDLFVLSLLDTDPDPLGLPFICYLLLISLLLGVLDPDPRSQYEGQINADPDLQHRN